MSVLVFKRYPGQSILVGDAVVEIDAVRDKSVTIAVIAPKSVPVTRHFNPDKQKKIIAEMDAENHE